MRLVAGACRQSERRCSSNQDKTTADNDEVRRSIRAATTAISRVEGRSSIRVQAATTSRPQAIRPDRIDARSERESNPAPSQQVTGHRAQDRSEDDAHRAVDRAQAIDLKAGHQHESNAQAIAGRPARRDMQASGPEDVTESCQRRDRRSERRQAEQYQVWRPMQPSDKARFPEKSPSEMKTAMDRPDCFRPECHRLPAQFAVLLTTTERHDRRPRRRRENTQARPARRISRRAADRCAPVDAQESINAK